jgi:hypothetical protein
MLLAALVLPVTWPNPKSKWAVGLYIPAVLFVQLFPKYIDPYDLWIAFAVFWVGFATVQRALGSYVIPMACYTLSGLTYFFGWVAGAEFSATYTGYPYLLAANIFAIVAILYAGWRGGILIGDMGVFRGAWPMGLGSSGRVGIADRSLGSDLVVKKKKEAPQVRGGE